MTPAVSVGSKKTNDLNGKESLFVIVGASEDAARQHSRFLAYERLVPRM